MRVCIVGNGPLAKGHGAEIDACDFVVRTTGWWKSGPGDVGEKLNAYAWFGASGQLPMPERYATHPFEHWFTLPLSRCNPPHEPHGGFWQNVVTQSAMRPIRWIGERIWQSEKESLMAVSDSTAFEVPPTTGFTAIDMAIRALNPAEIVLYGFDATLQDKNGWGDNNPQWTKGCEAHDMYAEKLLIHKLAIEGVWLGEKCEVKVAWPHNPILRDGMESHEVKA